jgi:hypothetical protein
LYEDNAGGLCAIMNDAQFWQLGFNGLDPQFRGKFAGDAAAWAAGDWEPNEGDGQTPVADFAGEHVAQWQDGVITVTRRGPGPVAGFSAQGYLGLITGTDTLARPDGATGIHWTDTSWTECFAVIDATVSGYDQPSPGKYVSDPAITGEDGCACNAHRELRKAANDE